MTFLEIIEIVFIQENGWLYRTALALLICIGSVPVFGEVLFLIFKSSVRDLGESKVRQTAAKMAGFKQVTFSDPPNEFRPLGLADYKRLSWNGFGFTGLTFVCMVSGETFFNYLMIPGYLLLGFGAYFWAMGRFGAFCLRAKGIPKPLHS